MSETEKETEAEQTYNEYLIKVPVGDDSKLLTAFVRRMGLKIKKVNNTKTKKK